MMIDIDKNSAELKIGREVYVRILRSAFEQTEGDLGAVDAAFAKADLEAIQSVSHRWKGDYANLRLDSLSEKARQLNNAAKSGQDLTQIKSLYEEFLKVFRGVKTNLN